MEKNRYSLLLSLTAKLIKMFFLTIFGFVIAYIVSITIGAADIFGLLLLYVGNWFVKLATLLICLIITAVFLESLR